jgi:hypothetical protein
VGSEDRKLSPYSSDPSFHLPTPHLPTPHLHSSLPTPFLKPPSPKADALNRTDGKVSIREYRGNGLSDLIAV